MTSRSDQDRLRDIAIACEAITNYVKHSGPDDDMVFDAIRAQLIEIGEAVKDIDETLLQSEPDIPWQDIARMRDHLTHRYFDTAHSVVRATALHDVPVLAAAVARLLA